MPSEDVIARLQVAGEAAYASAMRGASGETSRLGDTHTQLGKRSRFSASGLLKAAAAAGVLVKAYQGIKGSVATTVDLAKATSAFSRVSGLDAKTAQSWVVVAKQRGIEIKQLQMGMATLGRNIDGLGGSTKASSAALAQLGLSQKALIGLPMQQRLAQLADAFAKLPDGAQKAALAQKLFGRSGQQLLPVLNKGSGELAEQLKVASDLVPVSAKSQEAALKLAEMQRRLGMATMGVKVAIGNALMPVLTKAAEKLVPLIGRFTQFIANSKLLSTAGEILSQAWSAISPIFEGTFGTVKGLLPVFSQLWKAASPIFRQLAAAAKQLAPVFNQVRQTLVGALLNAFKQIAPLITDLAKQVIPVLTNTFRQVVPVIARLASKLIPVLARAFRQLLPAIVRLAQDVLPVLADLFIDIAPLIADVAKTALPPLTRALKTVVSWVGKAVKWLGPDGLAAILGGLVAAAMVSKIVKFGKAAATAIKGIGTALKFASANPIVLIIGAIIALGVALVIAYKKCKWFRDFVNKAFKLVKKIAVDAFEAVKPVAVGVFNAIKAIAVTAFRIIKGAILTGIEVVKWLIRAFGDIKDAVLSAKDWVVGAFNTVKNAITSAKDWVSDRIADIVAFFQNLPGRIKSGLGNLWQKITTPFTNAKNWVSDRVDEVVGFFTGLPGRIGGGLKGLFDKIKKPFEDAFGWVKDRIDDVVDFWYSLPFTGENPKEIRRRQEAEKAVRRIIRTARQGKKLTPDRSEWLTGAGGQRVGSRAPAWHLRQLRGRQAGGVVRRGEITIVGERGPELAAFRPGTRITPITQAPVPEPVRMTPFDLTGLPVRNVITLPDGRVLYEVISRVAADRTAAA